MTIFWGIVFVLGFVGVCTVTRRDAEAEGCNERVSFYAGLAAGILYTIILSVIFIIVT